MSASPTHLRVALLPLVVEKLLSYCCSFSAALVLYVAVVLVSPWGEVGPGTSYAAILDCPHRPNLSRFKLCDLVLC